MLMNILLIASSCVTFVAAAGKRGIGAPWDSIGSDLDRFPTDKKISWIWNWETYLPTGGREFEFVAMLRTAQPEDIRRFYTNMPTNGAKTLLCLNECEMRGQANMSPEQAANVWKQHCWPQKVQRGIRLGAPSITNAPHSIPWLQRFMELTRDVPPDFTPIHIYTTDGNDFIRYAQKVHDTFGRPVWITEFANQKDNIYDQRGLMQQVRQWMDNQWWIEKYSWFGVSRKSEHNINDSSRLLNPDGSMTDLAYKYAWDY